MSDFRTGVNGEVVIDPNEILGIEQDTDPTEDGVSVLLWPGRWRIRARSLAGTADTTTMTDAEISAALGG